MFHLIIHRGCIDLDLKDSNLSVKQFRKLKSAQKVIDDLLDSNSDNVFDWPEGPATVIDSLFRKGNNVILYGAYHNYCLQDAFDVLSDKGVDVSYHPIGCIKLYSC